QVNDVPNDTTFSYHLWHKTTLEWTDVAATRTLFPGRVPPTNQELPLHLLVAIIRMALNLNLRSLSLDNRRHEEHDMFSGPKEMILSGDWHSSQSEEDLECPQLLKSEAKGAGDELPRLNPLSNCSKLMELHLPHSTWAHMEGFGTAMSGLIELEELSSLSLARQGVGAQKQEASETEDDSEEGGEDEDDDDAGAEDYETKGIVGPFISSSNTFVLSELNVTVS
ncbi:hypothetical protein EC957_011625, partial [Mortierella hygrophila]